MDGTLSRNSRFAAKHLLTHGDGAVIAERAEQRDRRAMSHDCPECGHVLKGLAQELKELRSELRALQTSKEDSLADLGRCRSELERTQEELRACRDENASLRQQLQPKEEKGPAQDRYA